MSFMGGGEEELEGKLYMVCTGPGKPGKSWNLIIWIRGLESHEILYSGHGNNVLVIESHEMSWNLS